MQAARAGSAQLIAVSKVQPNERVHEVLKARSSRVW